MEDIIEDIIGMDPSFKEEGTDSPLVPLREGGPTHILSGAQ